MEDSKIVGQAQRANDARKTLKEYKLKHGSDLYKGQDPKSHNTLINKKKNKMQQSAKEAKPKGKTPGGRQFSDKAKAKITSASRPTRSKMIVKSKGNGRR